MLGVIAGDVIGSVYEHRATKGTVFPLFTPQSRSTDDTVLTVATAQALLDGIDYAEAYHAFGRRYPRAGYGGSFIRWLQSDERAPYGSWGNGSAMRVGPISWFAQSEEEALEEARRSAMVTHNHPEGIRGAQAVALAGWLARQGAPKDEIRSSIERHVGYDLSRSLAEIRPGYRFDVSCQGSVPEALTAFLESDSVESAIRLAISLGGDADTQAAIAGGVAEAFYGPVPADIESELRARVPEELFAIVDRFYERFVRPHDAERR